MSVKIATKEKLNANAYNRLVIREIDGNYLVNVSSEKLTDEYVAVSYRISDNFRKMNDSQKIISIVDSFLESTEINNIETSVLCVGYTGEFIKIDGTRELYLQIKNSELIKTIIKMIKNKYDRDRYKYCCVNSLDNSYGIILNNKGSSYGRKCVSCDNCGYHGDCENLNDVCPTYIEFKLMYINGNIAYFDKKFIERFIYDKLWKVGLNAIIIKETEDIKVGGVTKISEAIKGYSIICGNLEINFSCSVFSDAYVSEFCNNIVNRYNRDLSEVKENDIKKRQLKMEGF